MEALTEIQHEKAVETFKTCREEVKHEYDVLSSRLMSYITSQSFLVSAFAVSMNNGLMGQAAAYRTAFPALLCLAGFLLTLQAFPGIQAVCKIIDEWHDRQNELLAMHPGLKEYEILHRPGIARLQKRSLWFAQTSPWIFGGVWVLCLVIVFWVRQVAK